MWHFRLRATRKRFALSLVAVGFLAACDEVTSVGPTGPPDHAAVVARRAGQEPSHPGEARFFRLAKIVPGFGGYFFDGDGNVHVYLTIYRGNDKYVEYFARSLSVVTGGNRPAEVLAWSCAKAGTISYNLRRGVTLCFWRATTSFTLLPWLRRRTWFASARPHLVTPT
jgi:hypothetical protein